MEDNTNGATLTDNNSSETSTPPSDTGDQNGTSQNQNNSTQAPNKDANQNNQDVDNNKKAEMGKISQLERERNEYSKKAAEAQRRAEALEQQQQRIVDLYQNSPQAWEAARRENIRVYGTDPGSYEQVFGNPQQQAPIQQQNAYNHTQGYNANNNSGQQFNNSDDPETMHKRERLRFETEKFVQQNPDLDPRLANSAMEAEQRRQYLVDLMIQADKAVSYRGVDYTQALPQSHSFLKGSTDHIKQAEERGEAIGRANALADNVAGGGAIMGNSNNNTNNGIKLPPERQAQYQRLVKRHGKDSNVVKKWLQKISNKQ